MKPTPADLLSLCKESLAYLDDMDISMYVGLPSHVTKLRKTIAAASKLPA